VETGYLITKEKFRLSAAIPESSESLVLISLLMVIPIAAMFSAAHQSNGDCETCTKLKNEDDSKAKENCNKIL